MAFLKTLRNFGFLGLISLAAACQSTTMPVSQDHTAEPAAAQRAAASQQGNTPIDVRQLRDSYFTANPGSQDFELPSRPSRGFIIHSDGTMTFNGIRSNNALGERTQIKSIDGNMICMESTRSWSGACIELFRKPDGNILVEYRFGNGQGRSYTARGITI